MEARIKNSWVKPTDPILHRNEQEVNQNKNIPKVENNPKSRCEDASRKALASKSVDFLKSSYNIFYAPDSINIQIQKEFTHKKKTSKKLFINEKAASLIEDDTSPMYRKTKKLYPFENTKSSISIVVDQKPNEQFTHKEHIIDNTGGIMTTKKHFSLKSLQPSESVKRLNDKQKLLPSEYCERHSKPYNRSCSAFGNPNKSAYSANYLKNATSNKENIKKNQIEFGKKNKFKYPYVKDHLKDIFSGGSNAAKEYKMTEKISKNPFDILKKVPKFDWEK